MLLISVNLMKFTSIKLQFKQIFNKIIDYFKLFLGENSDYAPNLELAQFSLKDSFIFALQGVHL